MEKVKIIAEAKEMGNGAKTHVKNLTSAERMNASFIVSGQKIHEHTVQVYKFSYEKTTALPSLCFIFIIMNNMNYKFLKQNIHTKQTFLYVLSFTFQWILIGVTSVLLYSSHSLLKYVVI